MKYLQGDIFDNSLASAFAQGLGIVLSGIYTRYFTKKSALVVSFTVSMSGAVLIVAFGSLKIALMPLYVGMARIGISAGFNLIYIINTDIFPTLFAATAMGICNLLARVITILSPQVAELPGATPMIVYCLFCLGGMLLTLGLKVNKP